MGLLPFATLYGAVIYTLYGAILYTRHPWVKSEREIPVAMNYS